MEVLYVQCDGSKYRRECLGLLHKHKLLKATDRIDGFLSVCASGLDCVVPCAKLSVDMSCT